MGYKYKNLRKEDEDVLNAELTTLNLLLKDQTITLENPMIAYVEDMTEFKPFEVFL